MMILAQQVGLTATQTVLLSVVAVLLAIGLAMCLGRLNAETDAAVKDLHGDGQDHYEPRHIVDPSEKGPLANPDYQRR